MRTFVWVLVGSVVGGGCSSDVARSPIVGTIDVKNAYENTTSPRDLSTSDLVVYLADGERFPPSRGDVFHGTASGTFLTDDLPEGPFTLLIGDAQYEQGLDHAFELHEVEFRDSLATPVTSPFPIELDLGLHTPWRSGDSLVASSGLTGHPAVDHELPTPPKAGDTSIVGLIDWASVPGANAVTSNTSVLFEHLTTQQLDAFTSVTQLADLNTVSADASQPPIFLGALEPPPDADLLVSMDVGAFIATLPVARASWSIGVYATPLSPFALASGAPLFEVVGTPSSTTTSVVVPELESIVYPPLVVATYSYLRTIGPPGQAIDVIEGVRETRVLLLRGPAELRFGPTLGVPTLTLSGVVEPSNVTLSSASLVLHVDVTGLLATDTPDVTVHVTRFGADGLGDFVVHGTGSDLYIPTEAFASDDYAITADVTVDGTTTSATFATSVAEATN